jgi:hypothetical protein
MIPTNNKIIVRVNLKQKDFMEIGGVTIRMALPFENNYREKSPVIAEVVQGNEQIRRGQLICTHHNHFYSPSPYYLMDDLYSIPFNKTIFGIFGIDGRLEPTCGNMICEKIDIETAIPLPIEQRKKHIDRYSIKNPGWTKYKIAQTIFTRPDSGYEIVYIWQNIENRVVKVDSEMICGILK